MRKIRAMVRSRATGLTVANVYFAAIKRALETRGEMGVGYL